MVGVAIAYRKAKPHAATIRLEDIRRATRPATLDGTYPCVHATVSNGAVHSNLGRCAIPIARHGTTDEFEVDLRYGAFVLRQTDLSVIDVVDVPLDRAYTSDDWGSPSHLHAFGFNSSHQFDVAPAGSRFPYTCMTLRLEDGDFLYFPRISGGTGFADAVYMHTETSTSFYQATIAWSGDGWTLRRADGSEMRFPEAYMAKNLAQGAAFEILDGKGNRLELRRDSSRSLREILTSSGRWIRFVYDADSRIVQASDDHSNFVKYSYNNEGMLESVIRSDGAERRYEYDGRLMTAAFDERGRALVRNAYRSGLVVRQQYGNGNVYTYDYDWAPGAQYANSVVVALPDQSQTTLDVTASVPEFLRRR